MSSTMVFVDKYITQLSVSDYMSIDMFVIGEMVSWLDSTYFIQEVREDGLILKQNFSIGTVLTKPVKFNEVVKI